MSEMKKTFTTVDNFVPSLPKRIPGLDELRGFAILFVMIAHMSWLFRGEMRHYVRLLGPIGVNLFFVISGFLIAKILMRSKKEDGYFRIFYIRRVFRIFPLAYVMIFAGFVATLLIDRSLIGVPYYLTYTQNFIPLTPQLSSTDPNWKGPFVGLDHMWSLAVEEHFYFILPILVKYLKERSFSYAILLISCVSLVAHYTIYPELRYNFLYTNFTETWMRLFYFGIGILLVKRSFIKRLKVLFGFWVILMSLDWFWGTRVGILEFPIAILFAYLMYLALYKNVYFKNNLLAYAGRLCFGLYLFHYPLAIGLYNLGIHLNALKKITIFSVYLAITFFISMISFKYFEMPIQYRRYKFEQSRSKSFRLMIGCIMVSIGLMTIYFLW